MATKAQAYVCPAKGEPFELQEIELPPLLENEVELDMMYCGLCHTEISMQKNIWGVSDYPLIPGHEGIGKVSHVGRFACSGINVGDIVGVGWMRGSCGVCRRCDEGCENLCEKGYNGTLLGEKAGCWGSKTAIGCFSSKMRIDSKFVFKIPSNIPPEKAGPLMCAGATVWEPIINHSGPGVHVGVFSLGGLGHMAVKLLRATGATVTVFSRGTSKKDRALEIGATHFVDRTDAEAMERQVGTLDLILDTNCYVEGDTENLEQYTKLLVMGGTMVKLGIPTANLKHSWPGLIFGGKKIEGSCVCGSKNVKRMLEVASSHSVIPDVEVMPFSQVNDAIEQLLAGPKHFRFVLKW